MDSNPAPAQERLAAVVDTSSDGILILDAQDIVALANPALHRLFGLAEAALLGLAAADALALLAAQIEGGSGPPLDSLAQADGYEFAVRGAPPRLIRQALRPLDGDGRLVIFRDVTAERKAQEYLEYLGMASDDVRTPLTMLKSVPQVFLRGEVGVFSAEQQTLIQRMLDASKEVIRRFILLQDIHRLEFKQFPLCRRLASLQTLLGEIQRDIPGEFVTDLPNDLPLLNIDCNLIGEALGYLLKIASLCAAEGAPITVTAHQDQLDGTPAVLVSLDFAVRQPPQRSGSTLQHLLAIPHRIRAPQQAPGACVVRPGPGKAWRAGVG